MSPTRRTGQGRQTSRWGEVAVSFLGTYTHALDSKGRLTIPARLREGLGEGLILARGFDRCLMLLPESVWQEQTRLLAGIPRTDEDRRVFARWVYGGAAEVGFDALGRILVPDHLREFAELRDQAKIVGANEAIEIWSPDLYDTSLAQAAARLPSVLNSLAAKGSL
jgi:MraZ protein